MSFPFFSILPGHDLAYNEVVKPTRRWAFSYYFLYRWLPTLHPQQAMLIQVLRQCTWQRGQPTGRCQLTNGALCRMMGWSESSHKTLLAELERPMSDWFIRRQRSRKRHVTQGHAVEGAPRYRVMMDDPLTPQDQAALRALLAKVRPASPYEAAEFLHDLAMRPTRELWRLLDEQSRPATLPATAATLRDIALTVWSHLSTEALQASSAFMESAEQCQLRITGAGYAHMELDYMLRSWLPEIGINNVWLTIILRARCFHDPESGEMRDVVTLSRKLLEEQLGIPSRTFRRMLRDDATISLFHISPAGEVANPEQPRDLPHRGNLAFTVAYPLLPVAPQDRERYEALLLNKVADEEEESTSGQRTQLKTANQPNWYEGEVHKRPTDPAQSGQRTQLNPAQLANGPSSKWPTNPAQTTISGQPTRLKAANQPNIQVTKKSKEPHIKLQESTQKTLGKGSKKQERNELRSLLEPFQIKGIARILENPELNVAEVRGWIERGKEEVDSSQMGGYLFRRLCAGSTVAKDDPLPTNYRLVGEIEEEEWALFEQWWLQERTNPPFTEQAQRARYGAWLQVVKQEEGNPDRPDYSPHACWRRELERERLS